MGLSSAGRRKGSRGFSVPELLITLSVLVLLVGFAVPVGTEMLRNLQLEADARSIAGALNQGRLSAISRMTHYQLTFGLSQRTWTPRRLNRTSGSYEVDGAVVTLSTGLSSSHIGFRTTSNSAPPGFPTASSTSITFNSRGIPVNDAGQPTADNVVYLANATADYAVTVSLSGKVQMWKWGGSQWSAR